MALKFAITGDNQNVLNSFDGVRNGVRRMKEDVEKSGAGIENVFNRIKSVAAAALAGVSVKELTSQIVNVRGEFQKLEIAFKTMLGSGAQAEKLMNQLVTTAAVTPFDLKGIASGAKQLLAYGMDVDKVNEKIVRLGDIAAGLDQNLGDLIYLYGTTMAQGRMYAVDVNQFMGRGIPLIGELAKLLGVSEKEVKNLVSEGKVGFKELDQVITNLTDSTGRFGGLMKEQSKSWPGQLSNIGDQIDTIFNELGKQNAEIVDNTLKSIAFLVDHYEEVGRVILTVAAAVGEYRAALMVTSAVQNTIAKQKGGIEAARQAELSGIVTSFNNGTDTTSTAGDTAARQANKTAIDAQVAALERELRAKTIETELNYKNAASAVALANDELAAANDKVDAMRDAYEAALKNGETTAINTAQSNLNTASEEANTAAKNLNTANTNLATSATARETAAKRLSTFQTQVDTANKKANTAATGLWVAVTNSATRAMNSLKLAIVSNPIGLFVAGLTLAIGLLPMFSEETSEAAAEVERFGESAVKQTRKVDTLMLSLKSTSKESKVHKDMVKELIAIYEEYGFKIDKERDQLEQLRDMHDEVTAAIRREGEERQKANLIASYEDAKNTSTDKMRKELHEAYSEAEYAGTGLFDNLDADEYQEKADELTNIIGAIIQSEGEMLSKLEGPELDKALQTLHRKITQAYQGLGLNVYKPLDIDIDGIAKSYIVGINGITKAQSKLIESFDKTNRKAKEQTEAVDYNKLSVDELVQAIGGISKVNADATKSLETLNKRVADANSRKAVNDLLKDITTSLDSSEFGSKQFKMLSALKTKLESKIKPVNKTTQKSDNDKIIDAEERLSEQLLRLKQENERATVELMEEGREKRLAEIKAEYDERLATVERYRKEFEKQNMTAHGNSSLTPEQQNQLNEMLENARDMQNKQQAEILRDEQSAMRDYLKTYGSLMQKKLAITQDYEERIRLARSEGERKSLEKEKAGELQAADVSSLLNRVDWAVAFGDVGLSFKNMLKPVYEDLKNFIKTDAFRMQSPSDQKEVIGAMEKVRSIIGENGSWEELAKNLHDYQIALGEYTEAVTNEERIADALDAARNDMDKASMTGNLKDYHDASERVAMFTKQLEDAGVHTEELSQIVNASGSIVQTSAKAAIQPVSEVTAFLNEAGIPKITELFAAFDKLKGGINALKAINNAGKDVSDAGKTVVEGAKKGAEKAADLIPKEMAAQLSKGGAIAQIISAVLTILDILKDGIGPLIASLIDTVLNAIIGILENVLNGKFVEQIANSLIKGIGGIFKTLAEKLTKLFTFGAVDINWTGSNAKDVQKTIDRLTDRNEMLQTSIEDLTDEIQLGRGAKSLTAYETAKENQEQINQNYLDIAKAQAGYHNHHHSWDHYWGGFTDEQIEWIKKNVNADFDGDLFSLTPEEMKKLRANVEIWKKIQDTGKGGYGDRLTDKLDDYIEQAGKLEELTDKLNESLTGMTADGLFDSIVDQLMSLEEPAAEAGKKANEAFVRQMLKMRLDEIMGEQIKEWYKKFAKAMEDGLSKEEKDSLLGEYNDIINSATAIRDQITDLLGVDLFGEDATQQGATAKGYATASQESIDILAGTSLSNQISLSNIDMNVRDIVVKMTSFLQITTSTNSYLLDLRDLQISANASLKDIVKFTKNIYLAFGEKLDNIINGINKI